MIDSLTQDSSEENVDKEEPDFFEEHANKDNANNTGDQSPVLPLKKVSQDVKMLVSQTLARLCSVIILFFLLFLGNQLVLVCTGTDRMIIQNVDILGDSK